MLNAASTATVLLRTLVLCTCILLVVQLLRYTKSRQLCVDIDDVHLFAPHKTAPDPLLVTALQGFPFYVSCRPTHPNTEMTLWKGQSNGPQTTQVHMGHDVSYHPHTGFYVRTPNYFYNGQFHCEAQLNDTQQFHDFYVFFWRELYVCSVSYVSIFQRSVIWKVLTLKTKFDPVTNPNININLKTYILITLTLNPNSK